MTLCQCQNSNKRKVLVLRYRSQNFEEVNINTSVSSLNLSMHKETSINTLIRPQSQNSDTKSGYKSILANFGGVSVYVPDSEAFQKESSGKIE